MFNEKISNEHCIKLNIIYKNFKSLYFLQIRLYLNNWFYELSMKLVCLLFWNTFILNVYQFIGCTANSFCYNIWSFILCFAVDSIFFHRKALAWCSSKIYSFKGVEAGHTILESMIIRHECGKSQLVNSDAKNQMQNYI